MNAPVPVPGSRVEDQKRDPADFGGFANFRMTATEMAFRMCAARGCGYPGHVQQGLPRSSSAPMVQLFRVLCRKHFVQLIYVIAAFLGDPSPEGEASTLAEVLGLGFDPLRDLAGASVFSPRFARCLDCGGGFVAETQGMYSGSRYIHTCGVTTREANEGTNPK